MILLLWGLISACSEQTQLAEEPPTPIPGGIYVDASHDLGMISPYVYGANHGPWAFVNFDLWDEAENSGVTFLRFPGGNWGDENNLRASHLDDFMVLAEMIGAEPQVSVRLRDGTPEMAAELVRYANLEKNYEITYWSIGNEPELYGGRTGYEGYDTDLFNKNWRAIAEAMLAVDPSIQLIGPEVTQYIGQVSQNPTDRQGRDWVQSFLEENGDLVSIVSIHRYPFPKSMTSGLATIEQMRGNPQEWDHIIPALRTLIMETTGRELPIAVTEINSHWSNSGGGETTPDSFYNAIWWADVLGRLISNDVEIVAYFSLQSNDSIGGYGLLGRKDVRPTYYVYQLYQEFGESLVLSNADEPGISVYAARRDDGALTIMVINLTDEMIEKPLQIQGITLPAQTEALLFDIDHLAAPLESLTIDHETMLTLPAQSVTLYILH